MKFRIWQGLLLFAGIVACFISSAAINNTPRAGTPITADIPAYQQRFGRTQPVIAVLADNEMTELTDFVVPYAVLKASGDSKVISVARSAGIVQLYPALKMQAETTLAGFDLAYPQGADYVVVPAMHNVQAPDLQKWLRAQVAKGARIVGICDGAWVLAHAGLLEHKKAASFWYSMDDLQRQFPDTTWVRNQRYVADGNIVTTTGVTASLPASVALVGAIAGKEKAVKLAAQLGISDWSARHDSQQFHLRAGNVLTIAVNWLRFWNHEDVTLPLNNGVDDIALALYADAYSRTYRSQAKGMGISSQAITTRYGLQLLPDASMAAPKFDQLSREFAWLNVTAPDAALEKALQGIQQSYGKPTRSLVSLFLEYPQ